MTNDLTSAGVDAWVTRLYDTATINTRVSSVLNVHEQILIYIGLVLHRSGTRRSNFRSSTNTKFCYSIRTPRPDI